MNAITVTPPMLFAGLGALLGLVMIWRAGKRKTQAAASSGARAVSLIGRVLVFGGLITGTQWVVITYAADNTTLLLAVLGIPALFCAATLVRTLTVVTDAPRRKGGRR